MEGVPRFSPTASKINVRTVRTTWQSAVALNTTHTTRQTHLRVENARRENTDGNAARNTSSLSTCDPLSEAQAAAVQPRERGSTKNAGSDKPDVVSTEPAQLANSIEERSGTNTRASDEQVTPVKATEARAARPATGSSSQRQSPRSPGGK